MKSIVKVLSKLTIMAMIGVILGGLVCTIIEIIIMIEPVRWAICAALILFLAGLAYKWAEK